MKEIHLRHFRNYGQIRCKLPKRKAFTLCKKLCIVFITVFNAQKKLILTVNCTAVIHPIFRIFLRRFSCKRVTKMTVFSNSETPSF